MEGARRVHKARKYLHVRRASNGGRGMSKGGFNEAIRSAPRHRAQDALASRATGIRAGSACPTSPKL